jgi:hypothetical protein
MVFAVYETGQPTCGWLLLNIPITEVSCPMTLLFKWRCESVWACSGGIRGVTLPALYYNMNIDMRWFLSFALWLCDGTLRIQLLC